MAASIHNAFFIHSKSSATKPCLVGFLRYPPLVLPVVPVVVPVEEPPVPDELVPLPEDELPPLDETPELSPPMLDK